MKQFSFARFVELLVHVLEIGIFVAVAFSWFDAAAAFFYKITISGATYDAVSNFSFFSVLMLLLATLWYLFTGQPRAGVLAMRTSIYIVVLSLSPSRMPA